MALFCVSCSLCSESSFFHFVLLFVGRFCSKCCLFEFLFYTFYLVFLIRNSRSQVIYGERIPGNRDRTTHFFSCHVPLCLFPSFFFPPSFLFSLFNAPSSSPYFTPASSSLPSPSLPSPTLFSRLTPPLHPISSFSLLVLCLFSTMILFHICLRQKILTRSSSWVGRLQASQLGLVETATHCNCTISSHNDLKASWKLQSVLQWALSSELGKGSRGHTLYPGSLGLLLWNLSSTSCFQRRVRWSSLSYFPSL